MPKKTRVVIGPYAIKGEKKDMIAMIEQMTSDLGSITQEDLDAMASRKLSGGKGKRG